uniref:Protein kinase domain-containing protein n=2 Tax=Globodera pallida TaxID=36090 RepID=A0A183C3V0_GLOPA
MIRKERNNGEESVCPLKKLAARSGRSGSLRTMWAILKAAALFYFLIPCTNQNALKEIGDFMKEFASLTDSSAEVLDKLQLIGAGTFSLLKFAGPIAQIVHAGISVALSEDSEEFVAINKLHSTITDKFEKLSRKIDDVIARREYSAAMNTYGLLISLNLGQLRTHDVICNQYGSKRYVEWMNSSMNTNCLRPSENEAEVYAKAFQLIDYTLWKTDMLIKFTDLPLKVARKHLHVIEKALTALNFTKVMTVTDLSQRFAGVLTNTAFGVGGFFTEKHRSRRSGTYFECFLKTIVTRFERRREPLLDISDIIITDVIRLQLIGIMCASVVAKGDAIYYQRELKLHDQLTRDIANGMHKWILAELDSAWPAIITTHCSDAMGSNDKPITHNEYEELALRVQHVANERGNQNFLHQIIVAPLWEEPFFLKQCNAETCASYNKRGVKVVITRFDKSDEKFALRLLSSQTWINDNRHTIQSEMKNQLNLLGGNANLSLILSNVSKKVKRKHLNGIHLWRNLLFLHNRKWFAKECVIPVGIAGTDIQGTFAYDNRTEIFDEPAFSVANRYKLILLI